MWAWLKGATSTSVTDVSSTSPGNVATKGDAKPNGSTSIPPSSTTAAAALPVALDEHGKPIPIGGVTGTKPPTDGSFWGFMETNVTVDRDPALDDMMSFFGFAHRERESDYVGCVSFELSYPDGRKSIRTVQVLPKGPEHARAHIEEIATGNSTQDEDTTVQATAIRPETRAEPSTSSALTTRSKLSAWFPRTDSTTELSPSASNAAAAPSHAITPVPSIPRMPFSSRVRIHTGPVPPDVKVTARLICSRDIFFEVYLGRLDPMRSVLTGKAHCPGFRYRELMYFGQSFDCSGEAWKRFYATQKEIEDATKGRKGGGGGGTSGGGAAQITASGSLSSSTSAPSASMTSWALPRFSLSRMFLPAIFPAQP